MGFIEEFVTFLKTFGVITLAMGIVIGGAASALVAALVDNLINPTVGLVLPAGNLDKMNMNVTGISGKVSTFKYGSMISSIINFLIIALLVFAAYKIFRIKKTAAG